jgi:phosphatidylglycerophosphate synthase
MTNRLQIQSLATAANGLTLLRILLVVPLLMALGSGRMAGAMLLMEIAAATDVADGIVARRIGTATRLGAVLDPAADAVLIFTVQAQLVAAGKWPVYLLAVTGASFLSFAQVWAASGRAPGGRAGKYVGAVVMSTILLQLACTLVAPGQWDRVAAVICPLIAVYVAVSIVENIYAVLKAPGGAHDAS